MDKPQPKREVAVKSWNDKVGVIFFVSSPDAVSDFESFGRIHSLSIPNEYELWVDARFDFDEVVAYLENYG